MQSKISFIEQTKYGHVDGINRPQKFDEKIKTILLYPYLFKEKVLLQFS